MTFSSVKIMYGVVVSKKDLHHSPQFSRIGDHTGKIKIYKYPCCSKNKKYIVGIDYVSYSRSYHDYSKVCENCDGDIKCDDCFGKTVNGSYDMVKIFEENYSVPNNEICLYCRNHSRPQEICRVCSAPNGKKSIFGDPSISSEEIEKFLEIPDFKATSLGFFAVVDHCLFCS